MRFSASGHVDNVRDLYGTVMIWLATARFRDGPRAALLACLSPCEQRRDYVTRQQHEEPS